MEFLRYFSQLLAEAAPWLLLGLVIAGLIKALVPTQFLQQQLGKPGMGSVVKAALIGAPLPLCSCGVIPVALGLKNAGASNKATTAFLIATPETGVDSVAVTYGLMGPVMAIARPVAALFTAVLAGFLVPEAKVTQTSSVESNGECGCKNKPQQVAPKVTVLQGLQYAFTRMINDFADWLVLGLLFAAAILTWVPEHYFALYGQGWLAMIFMMLIGIPMYVCATASTPIAAGFLLAGVSPGAVLVFLLVGPATNISTLGVVGKELGKSALLAYLAAIVIGAFSFGVFLDAIWGQFASSATVAQQHQHQTDSIVAQLSAVLLSGLILRCYWQRWLAPWWQARVADQS